MKIAVNLARYLTGILFVFSGFIKAIDPLGLSYKMQEFFEAFALDGFFPGLMHFLHPNALTFSILIITLEIVIGVALIIGWKKRLTLTLLLILILKFTGLTAYVLFSGKIRACGCFGDCIPLTPAQTFGKDILLLVMTLLLWWKRAYIQPLARPVVMTLVVVLALLISVFVQLYSMKYLPMMDCLAFKKGTNILKAREMPVDAEPDVYDYTFVYQKDGKEEAFTMDNLPDETWEFVDRKQVLVKKGKNNVPLINDYNLTTKEGVDVTEDIFNQSGQYYLLYIRYTNGIDQKAMESLKDFIEENKLQEKVYVICSQVSSVESFLSALNFPYKEILLLDATAIKTAARSNPTLYWMEGAVVKDKWGWGNFDDIPKP